MAVEPAAAARGGNLTRYLVAFALTQLVEMPIYHFGARRSWPGAFVPSALTHPLVWFVFPALLPNNYWSTVAAAEAFAWATEGMVLHFLGLRQAMAWSLLANAASFAIGLGLRQMFGWP